MPDEIMLNILFITPDPHESSKQSDCDNVRRFPLDETENCPECPNYEVVMVGSWSSCIVDEDEEAGQIFGITSVLLHHFITCI